MHWYVIETFNHKSPGAFEFQKYLKSALKNYILSCDSCSSVKFGLNNFSILRKCKSEFYTRIHEALLIRKSSLSLNRQLYANRTLFLLNIKKNLLVFLFFVSSNLIYGQCVYSV